MSQYPFPFQFTESLSIALTDFSIKKQVTPIATVLAAFSTLLFRYTGQEHLNLSLPSLGAGENPHHNMPADVADNIIFLDLLTSIQSQLGEHNLEMDWEISSELVSYRLALAQSTRVWEGRLIQIGETQPFIQPECVCGHLMTLLANALANPALPLNQYPLLAKEEWEQIVVQWNKTDAIFPPEDLCIHQWIERQAARTPDNTAVFDGERNITYRDLDAFANQLVDRLQLQGVEPGQRVGIYIERSIELVIAMLAVLKSGCAFIVLDHSQPKTRVTLMLEDADARVLITGAFLEGEHQFDGLKIVQIHVYMSEQLVSSETSIPKAYIPIRSEDLCFILFTSGSTGKPKGVLHTHRNIVNRFFTLSNFNPMGESDVFTQSSPLNSIDAIDEILYPLLWGAATAIVPEKIVKDPRRLVQKLEQVRATHIILVPSLLRVILEIATELETRLKRLNHWIIGGEPLDAALAQDFYEKLPGAVLINFYGLTEGDAAYFNTSQPHPYSKDPPIGHAAPNVRVYLLNSAIQPVPVGVTGEICIGGLGIARGYLNLPELTTQRFITDPFILAPGAKLFRTGDLGRFLPDGAIEFLGRKDFQVKISGFRVELLEVEEELTKHPAVKTAVVVPWRPTTQQTGFDRLVAYVVKNPDQPFSAQEVRNFLAARLPEYAVPAFVIPLNALPLNPNGKVDRKALPEPQTEQVQKGISITLPRDRIEMQLVKIWEEVLGISPIGIQDSFFELGGDSLAGIRFLAQVEKIFDKDFPIDIFFHANTIAEFAEMLRSDQVQESGSSLVPIQPFGTKSPFFCVHADGGVMIYRTVAQFLGPDYPVYGLQAQGLDGKQAPLGSVEKIAAHYIRIIRTVQPHGPYHLGAFSLGGAFIFEMAQQLHAAGEPVGLVAFFDAGSPKYPQFPEKKAQLKHKISVHLISLNLKNPQEKITYLWRRSISRIEVTLLPIIGALLQKFKFRLPHKVRYVVVRKTLIDATDRYHPGTYPGIITLFRAKIQPQGCIPDPYMGWGEHVSGRIDVLEIEGNHNTIMKEKFMRLVAAALRNMIN